MLEELKSQENLNKDEIDKRRAEALNIVKDMCAFDKNSSCFIGESDQSFIDNNYEAIFNVLKQDVEKNITYNNSSNQIDTFINDLNKINDIFKEIVPKDFGVSSKISAENFLSEDRYKNSLSEYANKRISDIIHTHNSYWIIRTHNDLISRVKFLEENIDPSNIERFKNIYGLLKEIKTENKIFDKPINLTNKEATDNFLKTFKNISDNFEEINKILNPEKEKGNQEMSIDLV